MAAGYVCILFCIFSRLKVGVHPIISLVPLMQGTLIPIILYMHTELQYDVYPLLPDTMSPNAVFEYAGDREVLDEDIVQDIKIQEEVLTRR